MIIYYQILYYKFCTLLPDKSHLLHNHETHAITASLFLLMSFCIICRLKDI